MKDVITASLAPHGVMRAAINMSNFLLVSGQTESGQPDGLSPDVANELARRRGEIQADVTSAVPLTEAEVAAVTESLRGAVGQKVAVNLAVDPSLIGGLIVRVGSRMVDSSLRSKINRLQLSMKGVG